MGRNFYYNDDTGDNKCMKGCSSPRTKLIILIIVFTLSAFGIGFTAGYFTKKDKGMLCSSHVTSANTSTGPVIPGRTTTTTSASMITVTPLVPIKTCPPLVPSSATSTTIWSVDDKVTMATFKKYNFEYSSSRSISNAMIIFEFNTKWGSWYLDDVSIKERGASSQELIMNGGFETGDLDSQWEVCDPRYPWMIDGKVVGHTFHSGSYSYESQDPGVGSQEYLTQTFSLKSNTKYSIEFYVFYSGQVTSASAKIVAY